MSFGAILRKELRSYFNSPVAYIVIALALVFSAAWFLDVERFLYQNVASMRGFFSLIPVVFVVILPAVTMRSWAEERRLGTEELLLTLPMHEADLVLGKFAAGLTLVGVLIALTIPLPLMLSPLGDFQTGRIAAQYLGTVLLASAGLAVGQFVSAFAANQISAFLVSLVVLLALTLIGFLNALLDLPVAVAGLVRYLSFDAHFSSFDKGLIDTRDVAYFCLVTAVFLYLNGKVLVLRKWS